MDKRLFEEYKKYFIGLLPSNLGEQAKQNLENGIIDTLLIFKEDAIDDFCKRHNLCTICVTGGYDCDSDHK